MNKGERFRLTTPTFGLVSKDGQKHAILIERDCIIEIVNGGEDRHKMVEIDWDGVKAMMFVQDIQERGRLITRSRREASSA